MYVHDMCVCMNVCVRSNDLRLRGARARGRCGRHERIKYYTVTVCMMHVLLGRAHSFENTKVHFCRIFARLNRRPARKAAADGGGRRHVRR